MYWLQIGLSLGAGFYLATIGSPRLAIPVFLLGYVGTRIFFATLFRTEYWLRRGSARFNRKRCPNCNRQRHRLSGDWYLECRRCGWKVGLPVIRWLVHSVPSVQLRRSFGPVRIAVIAIAIVLIVGPVTLTPCMIADGSNDVVDGLQNVNLSENSPDENDVQGTGSGENDDENDGASSTTENPGEYNEDTVREHFSDYLNEERRSRGLQRLSDRGELIAMGEEHTDNMARHDYIGHTWPVGTTIQDRYERRGLFPECNIPIEGSNRFYPGAENAAGAYVNQQFTSGGKSYHATNEEELVAALVDIWMNSPPHRKVLFLENADEMGLGIEITDGGKVYAALELC